MLVEDESTQATTDRPLSLVALAEWNSLLRGFVLTKSGGPSDRSWRPSRASMPSLCRRWRRIRLADAEGRWVRCMRWNRLIVILRVRCGAGKTPETLGG